MRARRFIGAALAVMVAAALVLAWQAPSVAASGQQAEKPKIVDEKVQKPKVEKETITIH
jgi:hypothetical protein